MKYADSGVNIDAATRALANSKEAVKSTWDPRVRNELGAFGGLFQAGPGEPLLVASVDGVGTKVMIARLAGRLRHGGAGPGEPLRGRHPGAGCRALVLPRLFRHLEA